MSLSKLDRMTYNLADEALSISDISTYVRSRIEALKRLFSSTAEETASGIKASFVETKEEVIKLDRAQQKFLTKIAELRYVDIVKEPVFVPPGMISSYVEYMDGMRDFIALAVSSKDTVIEFTNFISKLMENAGARADVSYIAKRTRELRRERDEIIKVQAEHFGKNSRVTQNTYGNVVRNNGEWQQVLNTLHLLNQSVQKTDPEQVLKEIALSVQLVDKFSAQIKAGAYPDLSNETVSKIADYVYAVAQMMEIYSIAHFRLLSVTTAINDTIAKIMKL